MAKQKARRKSAPKKYSVPDRIGYEIGNFLGIVSGTKERTKKSMRLDNMHEERCRNPARENKQ